MGRGGGEGEREREGEGERESERASESERARVRVLARPQDVFDLTRAMGASLSPAELEAGAGDRRRIFIIQIKLKYSKNKRLLL